MLINYSMVIWVQLIDLPLPISHVWVTYWQAEAGCCSFQIPRRQVWPRTAQTSVGGKHPTCFENMQGNLLLNEGDNHPLIFCVCWDVPPQSNNTFIDSNFMQISPQVCNSRGLFFTHFYLSICFAGADSFPPSLLSLSFTGAPPASTPAGHPPTRFCSPLPNIWHCCANSFQMPVHTGEKLFCSGSSFWFRKSYLLLCSTPNQVTEQNMLNIPEGLLK